MGPLGGADSDPVAVAAGDFNRDGRLDVATANNGALGISVRLGNGNATFKAPINVFLGRAPDSILAHDLNGDGKLDLVTANRETDSITVLLGTGLGTFKPPVHYAAGNGPVAVAAGDLNGDNFVDLAVADTDGSDLTILFGNGTGRFPTAAVIPAGANPTSVAIADFNQDSKPDLAIVAGGSFGTVGIKLNVGGGAFTASSNYNVGFVPHAVIVGRFNNDAFPDLAVACRFPSDDGVGVLLGNANGTFQPRNNYDAGRQTPFALAVVDFDGNGIQDIVSANKQFANNSVSVLSATGTGGFEPGRVFHSGQAPVAVAVGDFNSDGVPDVVTADSGTPVGSGGPVGTVTLLLGNPDGTLTGAPTLVVENPGPVVAADLTGDGIPDLAVVTTGVDFSGITIFPGLGDGSFDTRIEAAEFNQPTSVAVGDFNGDQKKDLAVTRGPVGGSFVSILLGNGDGTFGFPTSFTVGNGPEWVAVDHFNGDAHLDLAVAVDAGISVLLGNGDGTFGSATTVSAGGAAVYVASADFNGDLRKDLAVVNQEADTLSVVFGTGTGGFGSPTSYPTRNSPNSVGIGFFNGDSKPDLAVPTFFGQTAGQSSVAILQNGANGNFAQKFECVSDSLPIGVVVADFNGDGKSDLAVANNFADNVFIFHGTGLGTFGAPVEFVVGDRPDWLAAADFNGDGRQDLAVVNSNSNSITLLKTPSPVASQFRVNVIPDSASAGIAFQVAVAALDARGHLLPGYNGAVTFSSSDPLAGLPPAYRFTAADNGIHVFNVKLKTAGAQDLVVTSGAATGSDSVLVEPAKANHLKIGATPGFFAGAPFDITVTAVDPFGNVAANYLGTVRVSTNDLGSGRVVPADYTFTAADAGVRTFAGGVSLVTAGTRTVSVKALGTLWPKATTNMNLQAAAASQLSITSPTTANAGGTFPVTVTARDAYGNIATGFNGTVQFASSDGIAVLPPDYTFTAADLGVHTFQPVLKTAGAQTMTVSSAGLTSGQTNNSIQVKPGAAAQAEFIQQPSNSFIATAVKPAVTVQVRDAFGNPVGAGVKTTLSLSNNPGGALLAGKSVTTAANGIATFKGLTLNKPGEGYTLVATAGTGTSEPSAPFTIYRANHFGLTVSTTQTQAGVSFTITVIALDALNQPDPTYAGTIRFTSSDLLADLPADYTFQPSDNGQHVFTVTLNRPGVQTITVTDLLKPTIKKVLSLTVSEAP